MSHKMNLGGTEKALLSLINSLEGENVSISLLLQEPGGVLFDQIPDWVTIQFVKDFDQMKSIIYDPPLSLIKKTFFELKWFSFTKHLFRYLKVKLTGLWHLNYIEVLKNVSKIHTADIAIAFAGPSDFVTYYMHKCVSASKKIQWIHFDVRNVIFNKKFGQKYYHFYDIIFCVSENAKLVFDQMFPQFSNKTKVFKNIISESNLKKLALIGETYSDGFDGLKLLTLGRLSSEKGQQMIPNVVKRLRDEKMKFRWYLVGDGDLFEALQKEIEVLGIEKELVLLGAKINPYGYVSDCDIYVQTSLHEGYCLTVHEAKIFDKPVVLTNVASATNLIIHDKDGLIVGISEEGIYNGVKTLMIDEEKRNFFKQNILASETVSQVDNLLSLINQSQ